MSWLKKIWGAPKQDSNTLLVNLNNQTSCLGNRQRLQSILVHSNFTEAMPAFDSDTLLERHGNILDNLYDATGFDREAFDKLLMPLIRRFSEYTQMLPASEKHHHHSVGGLLEHSLEVCLIATRRAKGVSFCGHKQGSERELDKVRWPISCAIAGLTHDLGKVAYDMIIRSSEGHNLWNPYVESLLEFGKREGGYRVRWRSQRTHKLHEIAGLTLFNDLLDPALKAWIADGDREILPVTLMAVAGHESPEHPAVFQIVHESDKESVMKYMAKPPVGEGAPAEDTATITPILTTTPTSLIQKPLTDQPLKPVFNEESQSLIEVVKSRGPSNEGQKFDSEATKRLASMLPELLSSRRWIVNERDRERGFFWVDSNSAWVTWPALYTGINRAFEDEGFSSYPRQSGVFFDMLLSAGIVERTAGEYTVDILIEQHTGRELTLSMARLIDEGFIKLLQRYAENQVQLTAKTALAESVKNNPSKFIAGDQADLADDIELETIDLTSGLSDALVNNKKIIAPKAVSNKTTITEYIRSLKNDSISWLREQGEAGECLDGICSAIARRKVEESDYGVLRGALWLKWPDAAKWLGDDDKQILSALMSSGFLRRGNCSSFTIQPSGIARISIKGTPLTVIAFDKAVTSKMKDAYHFDNDFRVDLSHFTIDELQKPNQKESQAIEIKEIKEIPSKLKSKPSNQTHTVEKIEQGATDTKQVKSKNIKSKVSNKQSTSKKTDIKNLHTELPVVIPNAASIKPVENLHSKTTKIDKNESQSNFNISDVFHLLDNFLVSCFSTYEGQVFLHEKGIAFNYFSVFYHDACTEFEETLKTHWLGRLKNADGVFIETMQIGGSTKLNMLVVPSKYMKHAYKLLNESIESKNYEG